jgi:hypothetical protein
LLASEPLTIVRSLADLPAAFRDVETCRFSDQYLLDASGVLTLGAISNKLVPWGQSSQTLLFRNVRLVQLDVGVCVSFAKALIDSEIKGNIIRTYKAEFNGVTSYVHPQ